MRVKRAGFVILVVAFFAVSILTHHLYQGHIAWIPYAMGVRDFAYDTTYWPRPLPYLTRHRNMRSGVYLSTSQRVFDSFPDYLTVNLSVHCGIGVDVISNGIGVILLKRIDGQWLVVPHKNNIYARMGIVRSYTERPQFIYSNRTYEWNGYHDRHYITIYSNDTYLGYFPPGRYRILATQLRIRLSPRGVDPDYIPEGERYVHWPRARIEHWHRWPGTIWTEFYVLDK